MNFTCRDSCMAISVTISYMLHVHTATASRAGRRSFVFSLPAADQVLGVEFQPSKSMKLKKWAVTLKSWHGSKLDTKIGCFILKMQRISGFSNFDPFLHHPTASYIYSFSVLSTILLPAARAALSKSAPAVRSLLAIGPAGYIAALMTAMTPSPTRAVVRAQASDLGRWRKTGLAFIFDV